MKPYTYIIYKNLHYTLHEAIELRNKALQMKDIIFGSIHRNTGRHATTTTTTMLILVHLLRRILQILGATTQINLNVTVLNAVHYPKCVVVVVK